MAYHFAQPGTARLPVPPPLLSARSRPSPNTPRSRPPERPNLHEFLRSLADETPTRLGTRRLRAGLAATPWQLQQSLLRIDPAEHARLLDAGQGVAIERVVAMVLDLSLATPCCGVLATWWLRRDSTAGLSSDARHGRALESLRAAGHQLAEIEAQGLCDEADSLQLFHALAQAARPTLQTWGTDSLILSCKPAQAEALQDAGFSALTSPVQDGQVLLHRRLTEPDLDLQRA